MAHRKKIIRDIVVLFLIVLIYGLLMVGIFTLFVKADENNSHILTAVISDPEAKSSVHSTWVSFTADNQVFFLDHLSALTHIEDLSQNQTKVNITYPKHTIKNLNLILSEPASKEAIRIVDAMDGTVYYDVTVKYNNWVIRAKITLIVIIFIVFCMTFALFAFSLHVNLTCRSKSQKKPKEQRVRAQNAVLTPEQRKNRSQARRRNQKRKK